MTTPAQKFLTPAQIRTLILDFCADLHKNGKSEETIRSRRQSLMQVSRTTDITEPDLVKTFLAEYKRWNNKTKTKFIDTYSAFSKFLGKTWNPPKYQVTDKLQFIPTELEIDTLIAAVLQTLKETGMQIGELTQLKWKDLDIERKKLNITPEKGSNPRILKISDKLIGMLNNLPKNHQTIFQPHKDAIRDYLTEQRKRIAKKLNNPRIQRIGFHTLRHYKGTMEYHITKDIIHVKTILGHKSITSTMIYINLEAMLFTEDTDLYVCKVAHNEQEAIKLIETGFQFVNNMGDQVALYRKRK